MACAILVGIWKRAREAEWTTLLKLRGAQASPWVRIPPFPQLKGPLVDLDATLGTIRDSDDEVPLQTVCDVVNDLVQFLADLRDVLEEKGVVYTDNQAGRVAFSLDSLREAADGLFSVV